MISVSIIDDDAQMRDWFRSITLEASGVVCIYTASTIEKYLEKLPRSRNKHFLFLDLHLKDTSSIRSIPLLLEKIPKLEIIIYSVDEQYQNLMSAFRLGASGYIVKQYNKEHLLDFFNVLANGGAAISPQMAKKLIFSINRNTPSTPKLKEVLFKKEIEILTYLSEGWTYEFIADKLNLTVDGVRYHIKKIYKKLKVNSRAEAVKNFHNLF